ncbi:MAG: lipid-A-disaccharide synthase [Candidatus Theseobacter exili]|nr:lipid-A-disaccharide synthase [Candidatus Theseobacter exili]
MGLIKSVMVVAGEKSGDLHASGLIMAMKRIDPDVSFRGIGGEQMLQAGAVIDEDITGIAVVGFFEVLKKYPKFKRVFNRLVAMLKQNRPDVLMLVDFPGFNLRIAKVAKKLGIPVVYYISPQVWAWGRHRIKAIARDIDLMMVIFPFEADFYKEHGVDSVFVGHPLLDESNEGEREGKCDKRPSDSENRLTVSLLPGSRKGEVRRNLPVIVKTAEIMMSHNPEMQFLIPCASDEVRPIIMDIIKKRCFRAKVVSGKVEETLANSTIALLASGTVTVQAALSRVPSVVVYKVNPFTWIIARFLVKVPFIAMANIIAGKSVYPEFLQGKACPEKIAEEAIDLIENRKRREKVILELSEIRKKLGGKGAAVCAAESLHKFLRQGETIS